MWGNVKIKCKLCREELTKIYRIIVGTYCVSLIANYIYLLFVCFMVFSATFNNISVISWWSVLLVEDPVKTTDLPHVKNKLDHMMLYTSS
jgi:hypothetical protein